jgi:hypothetical protein
MQRRSRLCDGPGNGFPKACCDRAVSLRSLVCIHAGPIRRLSARSGQEASPSAVEVGDCGCHVSALGSSGRHKRLQASDTSIDLVHFRWTHGAGGLNPLPLCNPSERFGHCCRQKQATFDRR